MYVAKKVMHNTSVLVTVIYMNKNLADVYLSYLKNLLSQFLIFHVLHIPYLAYQI